MRYVSKKHDKKRKEVRHSYLLSLFVSTVNVNRRHNIYEETKKLFDDLYSEKL